MKYVPPVGGADGAGYVDGDPANGVEGSAVPAAAIEHPQRELDALIAAAGLAPSASDLLQVLKAVRTLSGAVVGFDRKLVGNSAGGTKVATFTADELVAVSALGGQAYKGHSLALSFNGALVGVNGMDTGAMPTTGSLHVYAIYNPATSTWATLGTVAGSGASIYSGTHLPSGYTASCLIGSYVTNSNAQFVEFSQIGRRVFTVERGILYSVGQVASLTSLSLSAVVPENATTWNGNGNININAPCTMSLIVAGTSTGVGASSHSVTATGTMAQGLMKAMGDIPIVASQTTYYLATVTGGSSMNINLTCTGYTF